MGRLRCRKRTEFADFFPNEVDKMENLLTAGEKVLEKEICRKLAHSFNRSTARAGKPAVNWMQIHCWFRDKLQYWPSKVPSPYDASKILAMYSKVAYGANFKSLSELEFEARSSKDGAWYDVGVFLEHRILSSGEPEVRVRFVGFGVEEDEWVNVKADVRLRSIPLENSDCPKVKVGDVVLCFLDQKDQATYFDAQVTEIQRRMHDIRGCRCLFSIRYKHDNSEDTVRLRRLCCRATF